MVGVTKSVKLTLASYMCSAHAFSKKPMCGADAEATIERTDFEVKFGGSGISDEVKLMISIEAYPE